MIIRILFVIIVAFVHGCGSDRPIATPSRVLPPVEVPAPTDTVGVNTNALDATQAADETIVERPDFGVIMRGVRPRGFGAGSYVRSVPSPGGIAYYVAPTGDDANLGSEQAPFRTISKAAQIAIAGDVVIIRAGTYAESVYIKNSGTAEKPIVVQAENRGGVVLTGGRHVFRALNFSGSIGGTKQRYITLKGLIFRQYAGNRKGAVALHTGRGWTVEDCLFDDAGEKALTVHDHDVMIRRSTFQRNYLHAFDVYGGIASGTSPSDPRYRPVENLQVIDVVLRGNHTRNILQPIGTSTSVVKVAISRGLVIDNMESYENHGSGMWLDEKSTNYTIRNSYFHHNRGIAGADTRANGRGLYLEKNWAGGLIENNVIADNEGAGIVIVNSNDIVLNKNLLMRNQQNVQFVNVTGKGYELFTLRNVSFRNTYMKGWRSVASVWAMGGDFSGGPTRLGLSMDESVYEVTGTGDLLVQWPGPLFGARSIPQARAKYGWEQNGRLGKTSY